VKEGAGGGVTADVPLELMAATGTSAAGSGLGSAEDGRHTGEDDSISSLVTHFTIIPSELTVQVAIAVFLSIFGHSTNKIPPALATSSKAIETTVGIVGLSSFTSSSAKEAEASLTGMATTRVVGNKAPNRSLRMPSSAKSLDTINMPPSFCRRS